MWETATQFSIFPQLSAIVFRHHAPDKAGQFSGNGGLGDITFGTQGNAVKFSPETFIGFVGVGHNLRWTANLSALQCH